MIPQKTSIFCIIVHFGSQSTTNLLIRDFLAQKRNIEAIVVVDHGKEVFEAPVNTRNVYVIRPTQNRGYAAGINAGIRALTEHTPAPDSLVVCCNNDVRVSVDCMDTIVGQWPPHVLAGARGGYVNFLTGRACITSSQPRSSFFTLPYVHGSFLVATLATWKLIGELPEKYFMYWEDVAISKQARMKNVVLQQLPKDIVRHDDSEQGVSGEKLYFLVRNGAHFLEYETPGVWRLFWRAGNTIRLFMHKMVGRKQVVVKGLQDRNTL